MLSSGELGAIGHVGEQLSEHHIRQLTLEAAERFFVGFPLLP
jgi:hypothetical protein